MELFLGLFFGTLGMIIFYNAHWYLLTKEKSYLYYCIYTIVLLFVILQASKIAFINQATLIFTSVVLLIFILLFSKEFLCLKKELPKINKLLNLVIVFLILSFFYALLTQDYKIFEQPYSLLLSPLVVIGFSMYKKGFKPAKYYVLSYGITLSLTAIGDLNKFTTMDFYGNVPFDLIGNLVGAIILSYAIFVKTNLLMKERNEQSKMLIEQSKLASMGRMLENISHQWRQPLQRTSLFIMNMQEHILSNHKDDQYLLNSLHSSQVQLEYMSNTINDFVNFNTQEREKENFDVSTVLNSVEKIIGQTLQTNEISFQKEIYQDFSIYSYPNELGQVILNLMQNSQDALLENRVKNAQIKIVVTDNKITIEDNAGGITKENIDSIFEPYFTTKSETSSIGLGLYMSKVILKTHFNAEIKVQNIKKLTVFTISF